MTATRPRPDITDGFDLIDAAPYGESGPPHDTWRRLRAESPVHWCDPGVYPPFWAVTKHADICHVSKRPDLFLSSPGIIAGRLGMEIDRTQGLGSMRTVIETDPPEHRALRKVASPWFTARALRRIDAEVDASARELVDRLAGDGGVQERDFAVDVATAHPLRILSSVLGVSRDQEPRILEITNQLFGAEDEDLQREAASIQDYQTALGIEVAQMFNAIIEDRRRSPRDDLATVLAHGEVDGRPMDPLQTLGYYLITFTAGHDTTKNALAGGFEALARNPDELAKVKADPALLPSLVEEVVRWTSPVNYMKRTAAEDTVVGGRKIAKGDALVLFYASANRDEDVFDAPYAFRADREPNRHLGFGHGEHFCLGAHLARRSQLALFRELVARLLHFELAGEPTWITSSFVVGYKRLPIRYRLASSSG